MLKWRLLAAGAILVPVVLLCWLDDQLNFGLPGVWLVPLAGLITLFASAETVSLLRSGGYRPLARVAYGGGLLTLAAAYGPWLWSAHSEVAVWGPLGLTLLAMMGAFVVALAGEMARFPQDGSSVVHAALTTFVILYVAVPMAFLVHLRMLHPGRWGLLAVISVLLVVKLSDVGAYFVGRGLGRRRLAPRLSPNKTVAGAVGGLVAGCAASWLFFQVLAGWFLGEAAPRQPWWAWGLYGISLTLAGMLGDLSESLLKRDMKQKDSSRWLPGLGGVLDVMDSLLLAAPVGYLWWAARGVGP